MNWELDCESRCFGTHSLMITLFLPKCCKGWLLSTFLPWEWAVRVVHRLQDSCWNDIVGRQLGTFINSPSAISVALFPLHWEKFLRNMKWMQRTRLGAVALNAE